MGLSENVVYPIVPNGFADHEIPFLNGYFIGNIPYFQTNPYRSIISESTGVSTVSQFSFWLKNIWFLDIFLYGWNMLWTVVMFSEFFWCFSPIPVILMVEPCSNHGLQGLEKWVNAHEIHEGSTFFAPCLYIGIAEISKWVCLETGHFDHFFEKRAINTYTIWTMTCLNHWMEWGCPGALYLDDPEIYIMFQCEHCIRDPLVEGVRHFSSPGSRSIGLKNVSKDCYYPLVN